MFKNSSAISAVMLAFGLTGCGSLWNNYLDFEKVENRAFNASANNRPEVCIPQSIGSATVTAQNLDSAIRYACGVQNKYRNAIGDRAKFRRGSAVPILGLGAAALGVGIGGGSETAVLVTGLTGASIASGGGLFGNTSDERAYILGYDAIACTLRAAVPLAAPADPETMEAFEDTLNPRLKGDDTEKPKVGIDAKLGRVKSALYEAQSQLTASADLMTEQRADYEARLQSVRTLVTDAEAAITNARALQAQRVQMPANLAVGVRTIIGQVDSAVQQNAFSIAAVTDVVRNLASVYGSFTQVPEASPGGNEGGDEAREADDTLGDAAQPVNLTQDAFSDALAEIRKQIFGSPDADDDPGETPEIPVSNLADQLPDLDEKIARMSDEISNLEQLGSPADEDTALLADLRQSLRELQATRASGDVATAKLRNQAIAVQAAQQAKARFTAEADAAWAKLATLKARNAQRVAEAEANLSPLDAAFKRLATAAAELDTDRRILADVVNTTVAVSPVGALRSCGVDPDTVVAGLSLSPSSLELPSAGGAKFVAITGGVAPFSVQITNSDDESTQVFHRDPFARSFEVRASGNQTAPRDLIVIDAANRRRILTVNFAAPSTPGLSGGATGLSESDRIAASKKTFDALPSDAERDRLQAAICTPVDQAWGKNSQAAFEANAAEYPGVNQDQAGRAMTKDTAEAILKGYSDNGDKPLCDGAG